MKQNGYQRINEKEQVTEIRDKEKMSKENETE